MNRVKKQLFFFLLMGLFPGIHAAAQVKPLSVEKADSIMQATPKPLLILISTDWCRYCQMQRQQLLKNKHFQAGADRFYYMELNAESKEPLIFNGQTYPYKASGLTGGIHGLAVALNGSDRVAFPTWILLDKNYRRILKYDGILSAAQLKAIVNAISIPDREASER